MDSKKKSIIFLIVPIIIFVAILVFSYLNRRGDVWLNDVEIVGTLNEDGSLSVVEKWDVKTTDGSYRGFYKEIGVRDNDFPDADLVITDFKVKDNYTGKYFIQKEVDNPYAEYANEDKGKCSYIYDYGYGSQEIGVYYEINDYSKKRSITFEYTLQNMCQGYDDAVVLYWKQFATNFSMYIKNYKCTVYLPNKASVEDAGCWLHCTDGSSKWERQSDCLVYTANKVKKGTQIETRVLAGTDAFDLSSFTKRKNENKIEFIKNQEQTWYEEWLASNKAYFNRLIFSLVAAVVLVAAGIALFIYYKFFYLKIKNEYPEYQREIPPDESAAEMGHFYYYFEGGGKAQKNQSNMISATILDLARCGYIELIPDVNKPQNYSISVNAVDGSALASLKKHELTIYNLLAAVQNNAGHPFTMMEFKKYASSQSHYTVITKAISDFDKESGAKLNSGIYKSAFTKFVNSMTAVGFILGGIGAFLIWLFADFLYLGIGMLIFGLLAVFGRPSVPRLTVEGEKEYFYARGLGKYMTDFSNLNEHDIPVLELWEEYMVYATMMGISEQVLKELKVKYPELTEESQSGYGYGYHRRSYLYTYAYLSMRSPTPFDLGRDMRTSLDTIKNTARAVQVRQNSGNGHGGGFGHGGGGFGGGGGGFGGGGGGARH